MKKKVGKETAALPLLLAAVFYGFALWRWTATGSVFYLFNFGYLGTALGLGVFLAGALPRPRKGIARMATQLAVGSYLFVYVGLLLRENLQIEGFWLNLFSGIFAGATLHYFIAKIVGPFVFGRGWCGWACWTAMVLDLLPWKAPRRRPAERAGILRLAHFFAVLGGSAILYYGFVRGARPGLWKSIEFPAFVIGSVAYYAFSIFLAAALRDNRAFCRYACPVPVFQKIGARFSLLKIRIDPEKCTRCGKCEQRCPLGVKLLTSLDSEFRLSSTECVLCQTCANVCPTGAARVALPRRRRFSSSPGAT